MSGVYRGYSAAQLQELYNQSPRVPDFPRIVAGWDFSPVSIARSATGDVPTAGVLFIHGGYWQGLYKESWLYLAPAFLEAEAAACRSRGEAGRGGGSSVPLILAERWAASGRPLRVVKMPEFHHFNVVDELAQEGSPLYEASMEMVEGRWPAT